VTWLAIWGRRGRYGATAALHIIAGQTFALSGSKATRWCGWPTMAHRSLPDAVFSARSR
jgi:hypothetical protein